MSALYRVRFHGSEQIFECPVTVAEAAEFCGRWGYAAHLFDLADPVVVGAVDDGGDWVIYPEKVA